MALGPPANSSVPGATGAASEQTASRANGLAFAGLPAPLDTNRAVCAAAVVTTQLDAALLLTSVRLGSPWVRLNTSIEVTPSAISVLR